MEEYFINMGINLILTALKTSFKSAGARAKYKAALLKVFNGIKTTFAGDPDFQ